eukprot:2760275-Amphidinium_carterae.1
MRRHLTAEQAEAADIPAGYHANSAEADLLASDAVQEVPGLPPLLALLRRAAGGARSFWALF